MLIENTPTNDSFWAIGTPSRNVRSVFQPLRALELALGVMMVVSIALMVGIVVGFVVFDTTTVAVYAVVSIIVTTTVAIVMQVMSDDRDELRREILSRNHETAISSERYSFIALFCNELRQDKTTQITFKEEIDEYFEVTRSLETELSRTKEVAEKYRLKREIRRCAKLFSGRLGYKKSIGAHLLALSEQEMRQIEHLADKYKRRATQLRAQLIAE